MMRSNKFCTVITAVLSLLMLAVPGLIQAGPPMKNHGARIRLGRTQFAPSRGEKPAIPPGLAISGYAAGERGYYIVQFAGPIEQEWKKQVTTEGAEILDYIPDFAFKVRMTPAQAGQVKELESVTWVGFYQPAYKLSPDLKHNGTHFYTVRFERSGDVESARAAIAKSGARVLAHKGNILKVAADSAQLEAIARVLDVAWIQNFMMWEKHNEYAAGTILGTNTIDASYDGDTQTIAIADTGLGGGTVASAPEDIGSRITAFYDWTGGSGGVIDLFWCRYDILSDGSVDVDSGHGTHLTLSALGASGTAPKAKLIFQSVENYVDYQGGWADPGTDFWCYYDYGLTDGYYLVGIPSNIADLFQQAYNGGARIHSNSWGSNAMGAYTADSRNADEFIWNHRDMTITYSAGNSGRDANSDGVVDPDSIGAPSTAKNIITVGASENDRQGDYSCDLDLTYASHDPYQPGKKCSDMDGNNLLGTWGQRYSPNFPSDPIASDDTAGNAEQMAAWSSRGPTNDGRIKPDVVAPGTWILSGYSEKYQEGYGDPRNPQNNSYQWDGWGMPQGEQYKYMGGTSMSSPLVAGAAAVVRDFYQEAHDGHNASAALVKATLINSAHDLLDENNDGVDGVDDDNDFPIPNIHEGWGRVDLANATDGSHNYVEEIEGLNTGGSSTYHYSVVPNGPFKVTLAWSDYPSATGVSKNLVNDLDLVVTSQAGTVYRGNAFSGGWSVTDDTADRLNNVENVFVELPEAGIWTVEVKGFNVPYGPQPFALVVDGADFNRPPTASFIADPTSGDAPLTVQFTSESIDSDGTIVSYAWDFGDGETASVENPSHTYQTAGQRTVLLTVTDDDDVSDTSDPQVITVTDSSNSPPTASFTADPTSGPSPLAVLFDATNSGDPDGDDLLYTWNFGDGSPADIDSGVSANHVYTKVGTHTAVLTVADPDGAEDTATQTITVNAPANTMHIGNLTASSKAFRSLWRMKVTVTVHESNHDPVANATVQYTWSDSPSTIRSDCVTKSDGKCTVTGWQFRGTCLTFEVKDVLHNPLDYEEAGNDVSYDITDCR